MSHPMGGATPLDVRHGDAPGRAAAHDDGWLAAAVAAAWGQPREGPTVLRREPNVYASSFRSEFLTLALPDGAALRVFCKYAAEGVPAPHALGGHRRGVAYEADVYARVLARLPAATTLTVPHYFGSHSHPATGESWLFLEALEGAAAVTRQDDPVAAITRAAEWLGRFHAACEGPAAGALRDAVRAYDAAYFTRWPARTAAFVKARGAGGAEAPWLIALCERFAHVVPLLSGRADTVVHGEYYPANVLWHRGAVYPVDWESAAVASGEIDLASLTDDWPAEYAQPWERAYAEARWPAGDVPDDFAAALDAARLYFHFRWLGDQPDWHRRRLTWRCGELRRLGGRLGLI